MKITLWLLSISLIAACCGCSGSGGSTGGATGGSTGGSGAGTTGGGWAIVPLDTTDGGDASDLALSVGPNDTVGVAYYLKYPGDAGPVSYAPYDVRYAQWTSAGGAVPPQTIDMVSHPQFGLGLAISPSGQPAVAYLGGIPYGGTGQGMSLYWYQSQAIVAYQQAGGTWDLETADSAQADPIAETVKACPTLNMTDYGATGVVVLGLFSAIGFDSTGVAYDYFRDVHFGQSIGTTGDFAASNINGEIGGPTNWAQEWAFAGNTWDIAGTPVLGLGGHLRLAMANDQPALVTDEFGQSAGDDSSGQNVDFTMRLASTPSSDWSCPQRILTVGATQTGPSMAWNSAFGYAVTAYDSTQNQLLFTESKDGVTWAKQDDVYDGPAGWFPSIAISPVTNVPTIADFLCSQQLGPTFISECPASEQAIEVRTWSGNSFAPSVPVDPAGGYEPKIGFLSSGKMVIAYRQLPSYDLVLAVQQ